MREPKRARERDHRAVVGAEREVGKEHFRAARRGVGVEARAQLAIGAHAAGDDQPREAGRLDRRPRLRDQHVHDRVLELARDVGPALRERGRAGPDSRRTSVNAAVFNPLKLMSRSPLSSIGRGSATAPSRPDSARRASAGPPG